MKIIEGKISNGIEIGSEKDFNVLKKGLGELRLKKMIYKTKICICKIMFI